MATEIVFVYVTHPDAEGATELGRALVEAGVAACVNIIPGMRSIYRWEGKIEMASEVVMLVKTKRSALELVQAHVRAKHPYECPCIVALPVVGGEAGYLDWIVQSTATGS